MAPIVSRIILAAGLGARMGRTKALLDFGGATALELLARCRFGALGAETIVVVGHDADAVRREADRLGLRTVANLDYRRGRATSLRVGIAAADPHAAHIALQPVDIPLVSQATYDLLARELADPANVDSVIVPSHAYRRGHPVLVPRRLVRLLAEKADEESPRPLLFGDPRYVRHVVVDDPWTLVDLDSPEDYEAARRRYEAVDP